LSDLSEYLSEDDSIKLEHQGEQVLVVAHTSLHILVDHLLLAVRVTSVLPQEGVQFIVLFFA
jgi:hypothetical protein